MEELTAVAKVAQDNLANLKTQQASIAEKVGGHLNKLIEAINGVKATVEAETYGVDPNVQVVTPQLVMPIKVTIESSSLETRIGLSAFENVVNEFSTLQLDFSKMPLNEVYEI